MKPRARRARTSHAGAVLIGAAGVLIRGASGSGKSTLALDLVEAAQRAGLAAALVADDRVSLEAHGGRLVAFVPDGIAGLAEIRGRGIAQAPHEPSAVIRQVVDIVPDPVSRMPEEAELATEIEGVPLPRIAVRRGDPGAVAFILRCLSGRFP